MTTEKALLVFCEGAHDVAFCELVFRQMFSAKRVTTWKFSDYPSPFSGLFKTSMQRHAISNLSLDTSHHFFLPSATFLKDTWLILLFNCRGGQHSIQNPYQFLQDYLPLLETAQFFSNGSAYISESKYLFTYDVDDQPIGTIWKRFQDDFANINDKPWVDEFKSNPNNPFVAQFGQDKAAYVWAETSTHKGTLEDIVFPIFADAQSDLTQKSSNYIDDAFPWENTVAGHAKRKKAILTALGQGRKPGRPLSAILSDAKLWVGLANLQNSTAIDLFYKFVKDFTNMDI